MFRCITEIKGFVFDIDGFDNDELAEIVSEFRDYKILFMTASDSMETKLQLYTSPEQIYKMEEFQRFLSPNKHTHVNALTKLKTKATELIYISKRIHFLKNAMSFMGGTAWITESVCYEDVSTAPDLICNSVSELSLCIKNSVKGFLGEVAVYPEPGKKVGTLIPVDFQSDNGKVSLYMIGRYFGYSQYMSQLHPYSSAIYLNKKEGGKAFGVFNGIFQRLFTIAVQNIQRNCNISGICAVPSRPGYTDRFSDILNEVASRTGVENYGPLLRCERDYPSQKGLSAPEREENIKGVFSFGKRVDGENVIIIDDVVTTGSTIKECINVLEDAGANKIYVVVLAVNQSGTEYWSSNKIQISCSKCGSKMRLFVNSRDRSFFYSCTECRSSSFGYSSGRAMIERLVNDEFCDEHYQ